MDYPEDFDPEVERLQRGSLAWAVRAAKAGHHVRSGVHTLTPYDAELCKGATERDTARGNWFRKGPLPPLNGWEVFELEAEGRGDDR